MSILNDVSKAVNSVAHTAEDVAGAGAKLAGGVAGEALKAGESVVGTAIKVPLETLNQFGVASGAAGGLLSEIAGQAKGSVLSPFTDISKLLGGSDGLDDLGGGSVVAILLKLATRERGRLADKVNALKNLQAPGADATPQQNQDYESTKANLLADIQTLQNTISQITTMATNVEKTDNDTNMAIVRNLA